MWYDFEDKNTWVKRQMRGAREGEKEKKDYEI